jgi:hypothetical protein
MEKEVKRRRAKVGRLTTAMQVAAERGRIYRMFRWREITAKQARTCDTILSSLRQDFETSDIQLQIEQLRETLAQPQGKAPILLKGNNVT